MDEVDREYDPQAVSIIRTHWIDKQLKLRENEFTEYRTASVFCGTYNVNAKVIADDEVQLLDDWLFQDAEKNADIYAIGFQEIVDLNAVNVAMDGKSQQRGQMWRERLALALNSNRAQERYLLVGEKHLVGILILVFVKEIHSRSVREVYGATASVGLLGMAGNKGGVSLRFRFYDSDLCFVSAHLAAHRENVEGRNSDFANIIAKTFFTDKTMAGLEGAANVSDTTEEVRKYFADALEVEPTIAAGGIGVLDHDVVFWMGDLNYRLDESVDTEECFFKIEKGDYAFLRQYDQLNIERERGRVFVGFQEPQLNFPPTYKYQPGTSLYERRPEKKLRCPAWCDRVLWRAKDPSQVRCLRYKRAELNLSDHKPVVCQVQARIRVIVKERKNAVAAEIHRILDKFENDRHPKMQLEVPGGKSPNAVDFGAVYFGTETRQKLLVTNVSQVAAHFRFVPKLEEEVLCKPWLTMKPRFGMLLPGESAEIHFTAHVDIRTAQALSAGQELLDDILILRLENGQDMFLSVSGQYARSCFGMALEDLVTCYEPVRSLPMPSVSWNSGTSRRVIPTVPLSLPKELWRIVDAIYREGLTELDLFIRPGISDEVGAIRDCLDKGIEFPVPHSVHSMVEVLLSFFAALPTPIISTRLLPTVDLDTQNIRPVTRRFLEQLPALNYNVFVYLISFFRELLKYHECNRLNTEKLTHTCCSLFLSQNDGILAAGAAEESQSPLAATNKEEQKQQSISLVFRHFLTTNTI